MISSGKKPTPQLVIAVNDNNLGLLGWLVIDCFASDKCLGGIRMAHDVSVEELTYLARAMTLKQAFMNSYKGGAKAGILLPPNLNNREKEEILKAFGRTLGPILRTLYIPGTDLGIGPNELDTIKRAAGLATNLKPVEHDTSFFAAYGVFTCIKTVIEKLDIQWNDCAIAMEGYGKVGRPLGGFISQAGGRIVAISTVDGVIFDPKGLDIERLETYADKYHDKCVEEYKFAEKIGKSDLFALDVNILIPGARAWAINIDNVSDVKAEAIIPAANIPVTQEASEVLYKRRIIYVPDFVATSGGILGVSLLGKGYKPTEVLEIMERTLQAKVTKLIDLSNQNNISIEDLASRIAYNNLVKMSDNYAIRDDRVKWLIRMLKHDKSVVATLERIAGRLYGRLRGKSVFGLLLKPFAIRNEYRLLESDLSSFTSDVHCD